MPDAAAEGTTFHPPAEGSTPTPVSAVLSVHDSASEGGGLEWDRATELFGSCHGITDAAAQRLDHLEGAHDNLADQVDRIQNSVDQLLASQSTLSEGLARMDHGLTESIQRQDNDSAATQATLQLILQQLQNASPPASALHPDSVKKEEAKHDASATAAALGAAFDAAAGPADPRTSANDPSKGKGKDTVGSGSEPY